MKEKLMEYINNVKQFVVEHKSFCLKVAIIIGIIILIMIISSILKGKEIGNSAGNIQNYALAVQDGKWIYYIKIDAGKPVGINKIKDNGKKVKSIIEGEYYSLNLIGNYIYCVEKDEEKFNIVKIKDNGKKKEILARDISYSNITATEDWIYYNKNNMLYRIKLDGSTKEKISEKNIINYQIVGNKMYYIYEKDTDMFIAKMKLDGSDNKRIAKKEMQEGRYISLYVKGNKVYYILQKDTDNYEQEYYLCRMNKNGEKVKEILRLGTDIEAINMQDEKMYFSLAGDIYSMKYNGTAKELIRKSGDTIYSIDVTEEWIFFTRYNEGLEEIVSMIKHNGKGEKEL